MGDAGTMGGHGNNGRPREQWAATEKRRADIERKGEHKVRALQSGPVGANLVFALLLVFALGAAYFSASSASSSRSNGSARATSSSLRSRRVSRVSQ